MAQEIADSKLIDTWGSSGTKIEPDISKIIEGWQLGEQPPHEYMNWLQNTFGSKLNHILKNGVASWNNETEYLAGSSVQHSGNVWICETTNTNSEPTELNANWEKVAINKDLTVTVDTLADLRSISYPANTVWASGYHTKNDGAFGSNFFRLKGTKTTETDNGGTVIIATINAVDYVYELQYDGAVNVKWFGAVVGTVNSYQAFKKCFESGASAILIDDYYTIGDSTDINTAHEYIPLYSDTEVIGENGTVVSAKYLREDYNKQLTSLFQIETPEGIGDRYHNISFKNLTIKGQFYDTPYTGGFEYEHYAAINIGRCDGILVENCRIEGFTGDGVGISATYASTNVVIKNNYFRDCFRGGPVIVSADGFIIDGNIIEGNSWGIHIEPNLTLSEQKGDNGVIVNNILKDITMERAVIWCNGKNVLIKNNIIQGCGSGNTDYAMITLRGKQIIFEGNRIEDCHQKGGGTYKFFVNCSFIEANVGTIIRDNYFNNCSYKLSNRFITFTDYGDTAAYGDVKIVYISNNIFDNCYCTKPTRDSDNSYYDSFVYLAGGLDNETLVNISGNYIKTSGYYYIFTKDGTHSTLSNNWNISNNTVDSITIENVLSTYQPCYINSNTRFSNNIFNGVYTSESLYFYSGKESVNCWNNYINGQKQPETSLALGYEATPISGRNLTVRGILGDGSDGLEVISYMPRITLTDISGGGISSHIDQDLLTMVIGTEDSSSLLSFKTENVRRLTLDRYGNLYPIADNSYTLGKANNRWSVVYAGTGTINTSDDREKTYLDINESEILVAKELKDLMKKFKFNDSIEEKGIDKARIHYGTSAQEVKSTFEKYELVAEDYAILCHDEWEDEYEQVIDTEAELDEDGNIIKEATYKNGDLIREAGDRYGIRYEELLCFIISAM